MMKRTTSLVNLGPQNAAYRTPCPTSYDMTPREPSSTLGKGGILYGSREKVCPSYLSSYQTPYTKKRGARDSSVPREGNIDPSLVYHRPEGGSRSRSRRCISEDRDLIEVGWRGSGGRSIHSSRNNINEDALRFLPPDALNLKEPPTLIIKKSPESNHVNEYLIEDGTDKKLKATSMSAEDRLRREKSVCELIKKLEAILLLINRVQENAENLIMKQTESEYFQRQMKKETEGYDLQRGVYRILEALDGDRRELSRLQKRTSDMRRRQINDAELDGEEQELRSLLLGAADLEKKLLRAIEEISRLSDKTDKLIERQQSLEEQRRLQMLKEAEKNKALKSLIEDESTLNSLLSKLTGVKKKYVKAENIYRNIQKIVQNDDQDEMDTDEIILEAIRVDSQSITDELLKVRDQIIDIQDKVIDSSDEDVDLIKVSESIMEKLGNKKLEVERLEADVDEFLLSQKERYLSLLKNKNHDGNHDVETSDETLKLPANKSSTDNSAGLQSNVEIDVSDSCISDTCESFEDGNNQNLNQNLEVINYPSSDHAIDQSDFSDPLSIETEDIIRNDIDEETEKLRQMLREEAEKNLQLQRCEILSLLEEGAIELANMKVKVLSLADEQEKINNIRKNRLALFTILEEAENEEDPELNNLMNRTSNLYEMLTSDENAISNLKENIENQSAEELQKNASEFENNLKRRANDLGIIEKETSILNEKYKTLLEEGLDYLEKETENKDDLEKNEMLLLDIEKDIISAKDQYKKINDDIYCKYNEGDQIVPEDKEDMDLLSQQKENLERSEDALVSTKKQMELFKNFTWPIENETEMNKYGMVGSIPNPGLNKAFLLNPEVQAAIMHRRLELKMIREKLVKEEQRMKDICKVLEELEKKRKEAELRRLAEQALEWTKDYIPKKSAEFGSMPVFRSDFTMDPEEARIAAASRKASRMNSRESSVVPVEEIGALRGYDDILQGYGARSRQQSLERAQNCPHERSSKRSLINEIPVEAIENKEIRAEEEVEERGRRRYRKSAAFQLQERSGDQTKPPPVPRRGKRLTKLED